ncbi:hypothetical protein C2S51_003468 [Perilla frutescens var. frutescens]|nr:hypothetical protein C2S51_003468 [Perilla frutescens var. frutescens]
MAAEAAVSFAVETLGNLLMEKAVFLKGVEGEVRWLKGELKRMQCFLKDAAAKQSSNTSVRNWISETRDVAHDAQDAIEMFVLNVENVRSRGRLERCAGFSSRVYHLSKVGEEIESIRKRLGDIERGRLAYGIENPEGEDVIQQIMQQLHVSTDGGLNVVDRMSDKLRRREILQEKLHQHLRGKRYFIVLDDVWEETHWQALASAFPNDDKGSRLLFTSRNQVVTEYTHYVHKMKLLDTNESWELLLKKAFIDNSYGNFPQELENVVAEILKRCNGLPLAISVVGGLLMKQKPSRSGWEKVLKEMNSYLDTSGGISSVSAILELSYQNLPPELKQCFLCLGFFREDTIIRARHLIHIWVAQDLVPQEVVVGRETTMEEIARGYLDELINRNMVQIKERKEDRVKTCFMHDLLRDLSIRKAKEEINFEALGEDGNSPPLDKPRHRAVYCSEEGMDFSTDRNQHVRTLFIHGSDQYIIHGGPSSYWKSFELLRVLYLEDCELDEKLPNAIAKLIGLRYLGFRNSIIWKLPRSLSKLKNLQVLDSRNSVIELHKVILKMSSLRHLYAHSIQSEMPLKIEALKNIQTLSWFVLKDSNLEQLTQMTRLCKLGASMDEIRDASEVFTSLAKLENLVSLNLKNCTRNMEGLGILHRITQLRLDGYMKRLPNAGNFPPNISCLSLIDTKLVDDPMPVIEKLPKLSYLKLKYSYKGAEMVISDGGFPTLKQFYLEESTNLRNIRVGNGAMPELKQFDLYWCPYLHIESLPQHLKSAITIID